MMHKLLFFILIGWVGMATSTAQLAPGLPLSRTCGAMSQYHQHLQQNPGMEHYRQTKENQMQQWLEEHPNFQNSRATYTFAVVVHVVYGNNSQNIPDALIQAQIAQLNDDFSASNSDVGSVPSEFPVGNADIEFKLATIDPNGNPTTGITRTQTSVNQFGINDAVKFSNSGGVNAWNTNVYFNMWVCEIGNGVLGYAQFPEQFGQGGQATDGLVLAYYSVGSLTNPNPQGGQFGYGRTATHEMGHCLNLRHIWGDDGGSCSGTDFVNDTPNQGDASSGCPTYPTSSCGSNDMTVNYMDYSNDQCLNAFTPGQVGRMVAAINNYSHLQNQTNAAASVTGVPGLVANFSASSVSGCAPLSVSFTDQSLGGASSWSWSFPGGTPSSHNGQTPPSITYNTPGSYTVTLSVSGSLGSDSETVNITVNDCSNLDCSTRDNLNNGTLTAIPANGDANNGYVSGHNTFADLAIAEYFTGIPSGAQMNGAEFRFAGATGAGNLEFVVWQNNGGTPGAELFTDQVAISTIVDDVNQQQLTQVDFGGLVNLPTSFFIGFKMVNDGSNLVVLATNTDGNTSPSTAWSEWSDGTWNSFGDADNWDLDVALAVQVNVCTPAASAAPSADFIIDVTTGCETAQVEYFDNSMNNPTAWAWSFPGGTPSTSTAQNPVVTYTSPDTYTATLVATNAAGNDSHTNNGVVTIPESYTIDATASPTTVDLATGATVNFQDNSPVLFWYWDFGDGNTSTQQNPSHTYLEEGFYEVYLEVSDGFCLESRTFDITVENSVGLGNIRGLDALTLYPNPASGDIFLDMRTDERLELELELFNTVGSRIKASQDIQVAGHTQQSLEVATLPPGTYFVRITDGQGVVIVKFVKL